MFIHFSIVIYKQMIDMIRDIFEIGARILAAAPHCICGLLQATIEQSIGGKSNNDAKAAIELRNCCLTNCWDIDKDLLYSIPMISSSSNSPQQQRLRASFWLSHGGQPSLQRRQQQKQQ